VYFISFNHTNVFRPAAEQEEPHVPEQFPLQPPQPLQAPEHDPPHPPEQPIMTAQEPHFVVHPLQYEPELPLE
jgi:hypothetical protein